MTILDEIIERKAWDVKERKKKVTYRQLEQYPHFNRSTLSLTASLTMPSRTGIIAEFKRRSPSKGIINDYSQPADVARGYEKAGASAVSVLTDEPFFGGTDSDLHEVRESVQIPILRKDFIIDEYQVLEARAIGADVVLLIAACLPDRQHEKLARLACELGLQVLMEVHTAEEVKKINEYVHVAGVNNRNLNDFSVDLHRSADLADVIPSRILKISESGITAPSDIIFLRSKGYQGFLIGENFMKSSDPAASFAEFSDELKTMIHDAKHN